MIADNLAGNPAADAPSSAVPGTVVLRMEESLSARRALDALLSTPAPVGQAVGSAPPVAAAVIPERSKTRVVVATPVLATAPTASVAQAPVATAQTDAIPAVQRQQLAGNDALAQAQSLWNTGLHDAAIELMQQSIAVAERAAKAGTAGNGGSVLIPLAREMARMQLAEGRFGAVWEMLTRLEPQLGNQPDLWAIRANAAQRLGRHQDSVHAYMLALQSRPDEQRWLLGTAVSLAALGQTSSASEMAEKARAVGPVAKDILVYLRQAGVLIRD
jgi:tetratricopeptide (TPR) repeat protein